MVCGNFILPEPASYVFFYAFSNLRNLLYIIVHLAGGDNLVSRDVRHNVRLLVRHEKSASKNACAFCHIFTFSSYALALWR